MVSMIECKNTDISWYNRSFHGLSNRFTIFIYKISKIRNTREDFKHIRIGAKEQHTTNIGKCWDQKEDHLWE